MIRITKKQTGDAGEAYCVRYLKKHGYQIICRNYKKPCGEIDVIAKKGDTLCFVEVKTRHINPMTQPWEAVDRRKQQRLIRTAQMYLMEFDVQSFCRFDVCEVTTEKDSLKLHNIHYIENAFEVR